MYSIRWEKVPTSGKRKIGNFITVQVTCLDAGGEKHVFKREYEDWIGVCTSRIEKVVQKCLRFFPGIRVRYELLGRAQKILPYFEKRLETGKLDSGDKPFYKLYVSAPTEEVGYFFDRYKMAYYEKQEWLVRLYVDMCSRYNTKSFYYKWYRVDDDQTSLMDSFCMDEKKTDLPNWKIAAFDLETIPLSGEDRVPNGIDEMDRIVMISVVKWEAAASPQTTMQETVYYVKPHPQMKPIPGYVAFESEKEMLDAFHRCLRDVHVLTGFNINNFDLPCLFARLLWLRMFSWLQQYSSQTIGDYIVTTFQNKIVIDMFHYFRIFSSYDLPSFKLEQVAKIKLGGSLEKMPLKSTGIHFWYLNHPSIDLIACRNDRKLCYETLGPLRNVSESAFGTFHDYLEYCLRDSQLVYRLFEKEKALSFLIERANFAAMDTMQALHYGNSKFLLELFKTYGTMLGYFINIHYFENCTDSQKFESVFTDHATYQGALNYCQPEKYYRDVCVLDFASMYPSALLSANLCYSTCTIMTIDEWQKIAPDRQKDFTAIPYRVHSSADFEIPPPSSSSSQFRYPAVDMEKDAFVMVIHQRGRGFLPAIVRYFIDLRKQHQKQYKETRNVMDYNAQLCIKILINSLYGIMASKESVLAYLPIAMSIVTLARYQLLGSYHYIQSQLGFDVCYADTDSLMVHRWPVDDCDRVNRYLNLPSVELKFEQRMKRLIVLSKKRYVYETLDGKVCMKGFQKKVGELVQFMSDTILETVMDLYRSGKTRGNPSDGWILWVETLCRAHYMCRDPKKNCITRKTKPLEDYKSKSCAIVKLLKKYPEKGGSYVDYTYSRADVAAKNATSWIMDVDECQYVNFEQLFISQQKTFLLLLNIAYWNLPDYQRYGAMVLNTMRWKGFVQAELLHYWTTRGQKKKVMMLVEKGVKYTFEINDHLRKKKLIVK